MKHLGIKKIDFIKVHQRNQFLIYIGAEFNFERSLLPVKLILTKIKIKNKIK